MGGVGARNCLTNQQKWKKILPFTNIGGTVYVGLVPTPSHRGRLGKNRGRYRGQIVWTHSVDPHYGGVHAGLRKNEQEAMRSGPSQVTSTTSTEIPDFLQGPLINATTQAQSASGVGDPTTNRIRTGAGLDALFTRGQEGSPLTDAASGLTQQTLQGDFLSPDSNPFLTDTFNRAADLTRTRLDTEFAGAGRNLGAAMPARSEELQTLASNIFGGNFQRERDRQANAVGQAQSLAAQDFSDIQAMIDSGSFSVDQFIDRLAAIIPNAGGTTRSTQPVFRTGLF